MTDFKKSQNLGFLNFGQRCLGWFWLIEKLFVLAQIDVWECLGLSIVDLGQLIALEAAPKTYSKKVKILDFLNFGQRCLGWFWLIEKLFLLAQIDVWMALGLSIVDQS